MIQKLIKGHRVDIRSAAAVKARRELKPGDLFSFSVDTFRVVEKRPRVVIARLAFDRDDLSLFTITQRQLMLADIL